MKSLGVLTVTVIGHLTGNDKQYPSGDKSWQRRKLVSTKSMTKSFLTVRLYIFI